MRSSSQCSTCDARVAASATAERVALLLARCRPYRSLPPPSTPPDPCGGGKQIMDICQSV